MPATTGGADPEKRPRTTAPTAPARAEPARAAPPRAGTGPGGAVAPTAWMDLARVGAMLAVVVVHVVAPVVTTAHTDLGSPAWWAANTVDAAARWCVPLFVMISGALLLRPRAQGRRDFYRRRFARIGVPLLAWTALYLLWQAHRTGQGPSTAVNEILGGQPVLHLYFLFVLAGLYAITPFLRIVIANAPRSTLWGLAGLALLLGLADEAIRLGGVGEPNAVTRFVPFIGYYVLGYLLRDLRLSRRDLWITAAVFAGACAATALGAGAAATAAGEWGGAARYVYAFMSPTVLPMSAAAFLLFQELGTRLVRRWERTGSAAPRLLAAAADLSFGVYLVHVLVLYTLRDATGMPGDLAGMLSMALFHTVAVLVLSLLLTALVKRLPLVRATV